MKNLKYYIPGTALILLSILIIAMPEILVALVAATILTAGLVALHVGHIIKKAQKNYNEAIDNYKKAIYLQLT